MFGPNWYALNATRRYPISDAASGHGDDGVELPPGALVDLTLRCPGPPETRIYLAAARVTPRLVSLVFAATEDDTPGQPIASLSVPMPASTFKHLPLEGLRSGVGGWAVLGPNLDPCEFRASSPEQSLLLPACASAYRPAGVTGVGRDGAQALTGAVTITGAGDLRASVREVPVLLDGVVETVRAIVLDLDDPVGTDVPSSYVGPCGGRPQEGTCSSPAITRVGSVGPDCFGEVQLRVKCLRVAPFLGGLGGAALDLGVGMAELCAAASAGPLETLEDACESVSWASYSSASSSLILPPPYLPPGPPPPPPQPTGTCVGLLPKTHDFTTWTPGWPVPPTGVGGKGSFLILEPSGGEPARLELNDTTRLQWYGDSGMPASACTELNAGYRVSARIRPMYGTEETAAGIVFGLTRDPSTGVESSLYLMLNPRQRAVELYVQDFGGMQLMRAASVYGYYPSIGAWYDLTVTVTSIPGDFDVPGTRPATFSVSGQAVPVEPGQATVTVFESGLQYSKFWDGAWGVAALRCRAEAQYVTLEAL